MIINSITNGQGGGGDISGSCTASAGDIRTGETAAVQGMIVTGTMGNAVLQATASANDVTFSTINPSYDSVNDVWKINNSATITSTATAKASQAGYAATNTSTSSTVTKTAKIDASMPVFSFGATISGTKTYTPIISKQAFTISNVVDAASGEATTTAPTSGVYVKVNSAANKGTVTPSITATNTGIGSPEHFNATLTGTTVGANAAVDTYIPITTATLPTSASTTNPQVTNKATITRNTSAQYIKIPAGYNVADAQYTISATPNGTIAVQNTQLPITASFSKNGGNIEVTYTGNMNIAPSVTTEGYVSSSVGTKTEGTISASGTVTKAATELDNQLIAANIRLGASIFGIEGTAVIDESTDWVIDYGSSGTHTFAQDTAYWYWRKWNSGKLELWKSDYLTAFTGTRSANTSWMYSGSKTQSFNLTGVPAFVEVPMVDLQIRCATNYCISAVISSISTTAVNFYVMQAANNAIPKSAIDIYAIGRWK